MSYWKEVSNNFRVDADPCEGDITETIYIDAWKTGIGDEEGVTVAKVVKTKSGDVGVVYIDNIARTDCLAQEAIREAVLDLGGKPKPASEIVPKYCLLAYHGSTDSSFGEVHIFDSQVEARVRMAKEYNEILELDHGIEDWVLATNESWINDNRAKIASEDGWFAEWRIFAI